MTVKAQTKHAFTLIELLVVISIVSILIAILLPALANARKSAWTTQCLSNLRMFSLVLVQYAGDSDEMYPASDVKQYPVHRTLKSHGYLTGNENKIWGCPADTTVGNMIPGGFAATEWSSVWNNSYSYNRTAGMWKKDDINYPPYILHQRLHPTRDPIMYDAESGTTSNPSANMQYSFSYQLFEFIWGSSLPSMLHSGRHPGDVVNVLAGDGHVQGTITRLGSTLGQAQLAGESN